MGIIPFVNFYLVYKWLVEFKEATKAAYNPIIQLVLWLIPIVDLYFIWKFMNDLEAAVKKKGKEGYPMGATMFFIVCGVVGMILFGLPLLFLVYKTQELLNQL